MKLLLDENLSRRLIPPLEDEFPESTHVALAGLERALDREILDFAKRNGFVIVTLYADFEELSLLNGAPPAVIRLRGNNLSRQEVQRMITENANTIREQISAGTACVEIVNRGRS